MIEKTNQEINKKLKDIITEAEKVIKGKNQIVEKVLMAIISKGHILLEDVSRLFCAGFGMPGAATGFRPC